MARIHEDVAVTGLDAILGEVDAGASAGTIQLRSGSAPANCEAADSGTLLASMTLNDPAFAAAAVGTNKADAALDVSPAITDSSADASGTAAHFRIKDSNGRCVIQGTVGTSGADINFNSNVFSAGATVTITGLTVSLAET